MRVLLTWELGLNLGHLTRLLPVAERLKADGHSVLVAARDIQAAARVLGPAGIAFMQAPHLPNGIALSHRPAGYADIVLSQGWSHSPTLHGLTHAWLNLFRLYNPDRLLLDYSPTVSLVARIAGLPTVLVGNGFELPPATDPLPPFPGFSWATQARVAESEGLAVANANRVLGAFATPPITALRDLFVGQTTFLATLPQLDHYGERPAACYVGPLLGKIRAPRVDWPPGEGPRIFACVRPDTNHVKTILGALGGIGARVICVAAGFAPAHVDVFKKEHIRFTAGPVDLDHLGEAQLCITYGAEGTILHLLSAGVPQFVSPWHVETYMAARRIEAAGLGVALTTAPSEQSISELICRLSADVGMRARARRFAQELRTFDAELVVAEVVRNQVPLTESAPECPMELGAAPLVREQVRPHDQ